jgi:MFS family permease
MSLHHNQIFSRHITFSFINILKTPVLIYSIVYFFLSVGDAIMSYVSPIFIDRFLNNSFLMGLVISASSVMGLLCDLLFPKIFRHQKFTLLFFFSIVLAFLFPLTLIASDGKIWILILAMFIWGIYYELISFSHSAFIEHSYDCDQHSYCWGTISSFKSLAYLIGPILATLLISQSLNRALFLPILFYLASIFGFIFLSRLPHRPSLRVPTSITTGQLKEWLTLIPKVWPVYVFLFLISLLDSAFWTVGTLLSEQSATTSFLGRLILPAYCLPGLFFGILVTNYAKPTGKKRVSFITGAFASLLLILFAFTENPLFLVLITFASSAFLSVSFPEISAVFEDYVTRLGKSGDIMVGIKSSAVSASYIIGPIVAGGLASLVGNRLTFPILGLFIGVYSLGAYFLVPRKLHVV